MIMNVLIKHNYRSKTHYITEIKYQHQKSIFEANDANETLVKTLENQIVKLIVVPLMHQNYKSILKCTFW
jgi:hypothetical protein